MRRYRIDVVSESSPGVSPDFRSTCQRVLDSSIRTVHQRLAIRSDAKPRRFVQPRDQVRSTHEPRSGIPFIIGNLVPGQEVPRDRPLCEGTLDRGRQDKVAELGGCDEGPDLLT